MHSGQRRRNSVKDNAVTTKVIANDAVTTDKVVDDAISGDKIAPSAVTSTNIANGAVGSSQIGDGSIATGDLADDAVTAAKIKPSIISSIDGVSNDGGNVDLVAGSNVTITPDDSADTITIAATGAGGSVQAPLQLSGEISGSAVIQGANTGAGDGPGMRGRSDNSDGVVGWTGASEKSGVFGHSQVGSGISGRSDGNNGVLAVTTSNNPGHAGLWARNAGGSGGSAIYCEGDLFVTGEFKGAKGPHGGAPFPRPAYDSGWISIAPWQSLVLQHGVGGNFDNYFIDFQEFMYGFITNRNIGGDSMRWSSDESLYWGAYYRLLSNQEIGVINKSNSSAEKVRVRIWIYN